MPNAVIQFAPTALVLLLALIAAIVAWRIRAAGPVDTPIGSEYARGFHGSIDVRAANTSLVKSQMRRSAHAMKPLSREMRDQLIVVVRSVQAQFVDNPSYAVPGADELLAAAMATRGYPSALHATAMSVNRPDVFRYHDADHRNGGNYPRSDGTTEDLRTAMIHFRAMFDDLINEPAQRARRPAMRQIQQ